MSQATKDGQDAMQDMDIALFDLLSSEGVEGDSVKLLRSEVPSREGADLCTMPSFFEREQEAPVEVLLPPPKPLLVSQAPLRDTTKYFNWKTCACCVAFLAVLVNLFMQTVPSNVLNRSFELTEKERRMVAEATTKENLNANKMSWVAAQLDLDNTFLHFEPLVKATSVFTLAGEPTWSPILVTPKEGRSDVDLGELLGWVNSTDNGMVEALQSHGGLVFRGFNRLTKSPAAFEALAAEVARCLGFSLQDTYLGTSPRRPVAGTKSVYTSAEFPGHVPISDHAEMSFLPSPPALVFFSVFEIGNVLAGGSLADTLPGGETALIDYAALWATMDPAVKLRFTEKRQTRLSNGTSSECAGGVKYIRRYPSENNVLKLADPRFTFTKSWQAMFDTKDHSVAEARANANGMGVTWEGAWWGGATMVLVNFGSVSRVHPVTKLEAFHAHLHVLHESSLADGLALGALLHEKHGEVGAHRRAAWRFLARRAAVRAYSWLMRLAVGEQALGQQCRLCDGSPMEASDLDHVRRLAWHHMLVFPHREGDVHIIDNYRLAHSRTAFDLYKKRTLHATWTGGYDQ